MEIHGELIVETVINSVLIKNTQQPRPRGDLRVHDTPAEGLGLLGDGQRCPGAAGMGGVLTEVRIAFPCTSSCDRYVRENQITPKYGLFFFLKAIQIQLYKIPAQNSNVKCV